MFSLCLIFWDQKLFKILKFPVRLSSVSPIALRDKEREKERERSMRSNRPLNVRYSVIVCIWSAIPRWLKKPPPVRYEKAPADTFAVWDYEKRRRERETKSNEAHDSERKDSERIASERIANEKIANEIGRDSERQPHRGIMKNVKLEMEWVA